MVGSYKKNRMPEIMVLTRQERFSEPATRRGSRQILTERLPEEIWVRGSLLDSPSDLSREADAVCLPLGRNNDRLEILGLMTPSESRPRFALYDTVSSNSAERSDWENRKRYIDWFWSSLHGDAAAVRGDDRAGRNRARTRRNSRKHKIADGARCKKKIRLRSRYLRSRF
jgi:hypothetical protein